MGGPGKGQHTKMVNQIMIGSAMIGVSEAFLYSEKAGINIPEMIELLSGGAAASFTLEKLGPRMYGGDFAPGFYAEHFHKDLKIAREESSKMGLGAMKGLDLAFETYTKHLADGGAKDGTQAVLKTVAKENNSEVPQKKE